MPEGAAFAADGAVAVDDVVELGGELEGDAPAMAATLVSHEHVPYLIRLARQRALSRTPLLHSSSEPLRDLTLPGSNNQHQPSKYPNAVAIPAEISSARQIPGVPTPITHDARNQE